MTLHKRPSRPNAVQRTTHKIPLEYLSTHAGRIPHTGCPHRTLFAIYVVLPVSNASQEDAAYVPPSTNPILGQRNETLNALFHLASVLQIGTNRSYVYATPWARKVLKPTWTIAEFGCHLGIFYDPLVSQKLFSLRVECYRYVLEGCRGLAGKPASNPCCTSA